MKSFIALYVANAREFTRDRLALIISLVMPLIFATFFGMIFGSDQSVTISMGLAVRDQGQVGQQIAAMLTGSEEMRFVSVQTGEAEDLLASLQDGNLHVVMILPENLSQNVAQGQPATLEVYYDPTRQSSYGVGLGVIQSFLGRANLAIAGASELLVMEPQTIQTEEEEGLTAASFYVPSMLGLALLWLGVFGTAMPLVEMREKKVLRRLAVTPLSTRTVLAAQVAWRVTMGIIQAVAFVILGVAFLGLGLPKNMLLFPLVVLLGAVTFVTMGYFIAAISGSSESAIAIAQVVNFAMTFLSGSFFEPEFLPSFLRPVLYVMPLTYLSDALRQVMAGFSPLIPLHVDVLVLVGFFIVLVPLTIKFWRWE